MFPGQFLPESDGRLFITVPDPTTATKAMLCFDAQLQLTALSDDRPFNGDWSDALFLENLYRASEVYLGDFHNQSHVAHYTFVKFIQDNGNAELQRFWRPFLHNAMDLECVNCNFFGLLSSDRSAANIRQTPQRWVTLIRMARSCPDIPYHQHLCTLYDSCTRWCQAHGVPPVSLPMFDVPSDFCANSLFLVNVLFFIHGDIHHPDFSAMGGSVPFPLFFARPKNLGMLLANRMAYLAHNSSMRFSQYLEMVQDPYHATIWLPHDEKLRQLAHTGTHHQFAYKGALTTMMPLFVTV
jgi:hypothetical protein